MPSLVVLFNLKDASAKDAYENWAQTTDVPTVTQLSSIDDFKVYRLNSVMGSDQQPPYQYCEVIHINDMDTFGTEVSTDTMKRIASEFQAFADNPTFIISDHIA